MAGVSILAANIVAIYVDSFLYGIFFILSLTSIYLILRYNKDNGSTSFKPISMLRRPMLLGTILLFLIITSHWVLTFVQLFQAFISIGSASAPKVQFFDNESDIAQISLFLAGLVVSDIMFTYRLWVIWNHNTYVVIFPVCTVIALAVCSVGITYQFTLYTSPVTVNSTYMLAVAQWIRSECILTLCTNVYCTTMISWHIWTIHKATVSMNSRKKSNLLSVIAAFVESAALCTTWTIFFFITFETHSNLQVFAQVTWATVSGIAFTLITVRIGLGWGSTPNTAYAVHQPPRLAVPSSTLDSFPTMPRISEPETKDGVCIHITGTTTIV